MKELDVNYTHGRMKQIEIKIIVYNFLVLRQRIIRPDWDQNFR
jgi:hypothetical protein